MKNTIYLFLISLLGCTTPRTLSPTTQVYPYGSDSLLVDVRFLDKKSDSTISIYVLDASLDKRVSKLEKVLAAKESTTNFRIIGIGQSKYSGKKRRRDFVPPNDTSFFGANAHFNGRADLFVRFIKDSIVAGVDAITDRRILIGHSFGGLFGVYCSTQPYTHFDEIYALSPSLWVNHNSFSKYYASTDSLQIHRPLYISYGSLEQLNFVGPSITKFSDKLKDQDTSEVSIQYVKGKTHISMIKEIPTIKF